MAATKSSRRGPGSKGSASAPWQQRKKFKKLIGIKINTYIGQVNRVQVQPRMIQLNFELTEINGTARDTKEAMETGVIEKGEEKEKKRKRAYPRRKCHSNHPLNGLQKKGRASRYVGCCKRVKKQKISHPTNHLA